MPRFKDQAICIRHIDWSETSQVVVLLTQEHGKLRGLAKGSKRQSPSSVQRFSGGIELLTLGQVVAVTRPTAELATLTEWDLQNDYHHLRCDFHAQRLAMYAADLCHALLADEDPHPGAFEAMSCFLEALRDREQHALALLHFQWALLTDCGYRPELERDVRLGSELKAEKAYTFDPIAGGLTNENGIADWRVRRRTVELLRTLAKGEPLTGADHETIDRANRLLCVYARSILDKELPTMRCVLNGG
ncbi:MAG: DNA repair protein RecO [Phycisphaeraceae bacterium]